MSRQTIQCRRCGHHNVSDSRYCNRCGYPIVGDAGVTAVGPELAQTASAKSIIAFVLGVLSILMLGFVAGVPAMILARHEEDKIRNGNSPLAGEMLAKLGFWLGLMGTILSGLAILFILFLILAGISIPFIFGCSI